MKSILCYGDSNTWGYNPVDGNRHRYEDRWTTQLQTLLGEEYNVIPEGLNGRTTVWDDPIKECVNGKDYLIPCLESHKPIDKVVIMLGTNDLKLRLNLPAKDIADGLELLIKKIIKSDTGVDGSPDILILIPPETRELSNFKESFGDCHQKSLNIVPYYKDIAKRYGLNYLEIGKYVRFSNLDGIHMESDQLGIFAQKVYEKIKK